MRGQTSLYDTFFPQVPKENPNANRGRSLDRITERNKLMCYRYYYYAAHKNYTYTKVIEELYNEFFLMETRIVVVLTDNHSLLKQIFNEKPLLSEIKKQYRWLNWDL